MLAFNIAQFFPSLNHQLFSHILNKAGLDCKVSNFFKNYLVGRKTKYCWNDFISPIFNINIGVGQGSVLLSILSALYLSPVFQILEKRLKILNISISIISFVDNGLFVSQNKSISLSNANLFCSYNIISSLLLKFGLIIEHGKTNVFHFSRAHGPFNPSVLDLSPLGGPSLFPKETWKYLGFIFNCKLTFRNHIDFYSNKAILTIKYMKLLGNSMRSINPIQKRWLYRCCALSMVLYGFSLWFYNKSPIYYHFNILRKIQRRATLWITGIFWTALSLGVEAIAGLVPIHLYIKKLYGRFLLCQFSLPSNYIIHSILSSDRSHEHSSHNAPIDYLMAKQKSRLKSSFINVHDKRNEFFPSFSFFNHEFKPRNCIIDIFSDCLSFHPHTPNVKKNISNLEKIIIKASIDSFTTIIVLDASIKNQVVTSVSHIYSYDKPVIKKLYRAVNITTAEAKLFAMWYRINQAVMNYNIKHIVIISDSLYVTRKIFDSSTHPYQIYSAAVSSELREFFSRDSQNCIKFWDCSSKLQWALHHVVDQDTKYMISVLSFPCKSSWDFCKKSECDSIILLWRMTF